MTFGLPHTPDPLKCVKFPGLLLPGLWPLPHPPLVPLLGFLIHLLLWGENGRYEGSDEGAVLFLLCLNVFETLQL